MAQNLDPNIFIGDWRTRQKQFRDLGATEAQMNQVAQENFQYATQLANAGVASMEQLMALYQQQGMPLPQAIQAAQAQYQQQIAQNGPAALWGKKQAAAAPQTGGFTPDLKYNTIPTPFQSQDPNTGMVSFRDPALPPEGAISPFTGKVGPIQGAKYASNPTGYLTGQHGPPTELPPGYGQPFDFSKSPIIGPGTGRTRTYGWNPQGNTGNVGLQPPSFNQQPGTTQPTPGAPPPMTPPSMPLPPQAPNIPPPPPTSGPPAAPPPK